MIDPPATEVLSQEQIDETVGAIAAVQRPNGCIPYFEDGPADPWDHVEAAMALSTGGKKLEAERAYGWLASSQAADGSWASEYRDGKATDETRDANFTSYIAAGLWHHWLATRDTGFLNVMWPTLERAIDFTLDLQADSGAILWARDAQGRPWSRGLLTSSSCIYLSVRCAIAVAELLGRERPDWELALTPLRSAIRTRPDAFDRKDRYSMDWYYPVLGGALTGDEAIARLESRWSDFVVDERGIRCVADRPWVTSAETCELVLAFDCAGMREQAARVFSWVQHLRAEDGAYWTGATHPDGTVWPREKPTWSSAVVVLAADALKRTSPTSGFFRGEGLPASARVSEPVADSL
jgi:hypothetical protein